MNDSAGRSRARGNPRHWQAVLLLRFPMARSVGFECFKGWRPILARFLERFEAAIAALPPDTRDDFQIDQIKQKFGRLTIYLSKEGTPEMKAAIAEAGDVSMVTCEVCSAPGVLANRNAYTSVRCAQHEDWTRFDDDA